MRVAKEVKAKCGGCNWGWFGRENSFGRNKDILATMERLHKKNWPGSECSQPQIIIEIRSLPKRHRLILEALRKLGGVGTTREIAKAAKLNVNGISQSLAVLSREYISISEYLGHGQMRWWLAKGAFL